MMESTPTSSGTRRGFVSSKQIRRIVLAGHGPPSGYLCKVGGFGCRETILQGYDICRMNDLISTAKHWQEQVILKYRLKLRITHMRMVGWSGADNGDPCGNGKCRLGYMFGLLPTSLKDPYHLIHWSPRLTRRAVGSSLWGRNVCV